MNDETEEHLDAQDVRLDTQDHLLVSMAEGLDLLTIQSQTLNERVYTKNSLDRTRNTLIGAMIAVVLIVGVVFGILLSRQNRAFRAEEKRAAERSAEAVEQRRRFADCQVPPGTPLYEGVKPGEPPYINPGECYKRSQNAVSGAIIRVSENLRFSQNCIYLRGQGLRPPVCQEVNDGIDALKGNTNPFPTVTPASTTTTTTVGRSTIRGPTTTTTVKPSATTTTTRPSPTTTAVPGLVCDLLRLVGACR